MEKRIQNSIIKYLKKLDKTWIYKASDKFIAGIPDIIICYKGNFVAIEVKSPTRPSKTHHRLQLFTGEQIKRAGGDFIVATSVQEVQHLINWIDTMRDGDELPSN